MIIRKILYYGKAYILNFPIAMFHEVCHFIPGFIFWVVGIFPHCPKIRITKWYCIKQTGYGTSETNSLQTHVTTWSYNDKLSKFCVHIVEIMPLFGTITLFIISPWWMWIWYLCEIETLFLSLSDMQDLQGKADQREEKQPQPTMKPDEFDVVEKYDKY